MPASSVGTLAPMGLDARDYMRRDRPSWSGPATWSITTRIIVANVGIWFVYAVSARWGTPGSGLYAFMTEYLALHPADVFGRWRIWQPFTAMWLHSPGLGHVFFNMLFLYFFGPVVERMLDRRSYLTLYIGGGALSGLSMVPLASVTPISYALGASGAVYAVGVFAALRAPRMRVIFFFVPMTLGVMVFGFMIGWELLSVALRQGSLGTSVAHLVGGAFGYLYERRLSSRPPVSGGGVFAELKKKADAARERQALRSGAEDRARVDRLLAKIHAEGITSLTDEEKSFLERTSRRFGR